MVDSRRTSSLRNITSLLSARFWTLTYGINRLYAEDHKYEIFYVIPDNQTRRVACEQFPGVVQELQGVVPGKCIKLFRQCSIGLPGTVQAQRP